MFQFYSKVLPMFLDFFLPETRFNEPKAQKSIGEESGDLTGASINDVTFISMCDFFFVKDAVVDLDV